MVYKATYKPSGLHVAVKVAHFAHSCLLGNRFEKPRGRTSDRATASPIGQERQRRDILQEIKVGLMTAEHPNLVRIIGACISAPNLFVVFELVDGLDLETLYRQKRTSKGLYRPALDIVLRWAEQLFGVLSFLHGNRPALLHRDVKPANVMICSNMHTLKLVDFGLAVSLSNKRSRAGERVVSGTGMSHAHSHSHSSSSTAHSPIGGAEDTPQQRMTGKTGSFRYMAPEVMMEHAQYADKVDVFSATMVMWYMLIGEPPFTGMSGDVVALMAARENLRPSVKNIKNAKVVQILKSGWEGDETKRATAAQLTQEIRTLRQELEEAQAKTATASARQALTSVKQSLRPVSKALKAFSRVAGLRGSPRTPEGSSSPTGSPATAAASGAATSTLPRSLTGDLNPESSLGSRSCPRPPGTLSRSVSMTEDVMRRIGTGGS
eukprot:Tamp_09266.p1 GENE.Tamp_09266~~Tamp_09266.p1  ORF type:complete len:503 (+),score=58.06 Tamp_09266:207-1511(+)